MRFQGKLAQWNDERGFGWIEADEGGERVFVHISAFTPRPPADQRPKNGLRLEFSVGLENGKKRAQQVAWRTAAGRTPSAQPQMRSRTHEQARRASISSQRHRASAEGWHASSQLSYGVLLVWLICMLACAVLWGVPRWMALGYAGLSAVTFMVYWQDKWAAKKGLWRTSEKTLQVLALAGGWPGGVLAQQWLRHKSSKTSFQVEFWFMVLLNVVAAGWLLSPYGRPWLG